MGVTGELQRTSSREYWRRVACHGCHAELPALYVTISLQHWPLFCPFISRFSKLSLIPHRCSQDYLCHQTHRGCVWLRLTPSPGCTVVERRCKLWGNTMWEGTDVTENHKSEMQNNIPLRSPRGYIHFAHMWDIHIYIQSMDPHVSYTYIYKAWIRYRYKPSLLLRWPEVTFIKLSSNFLILLSHLVP